MKRKGVCAPSPAPLTLRLGRRRRSEAKTRTAAAAREMDDIAFRDASREVSRSMADIFALRHPIALTNSANFHSILPLLNRALGIELYTADMLRRCNSGQLCTIGMTALRANAKNFPGNAEAACDTDNLPDMNAYMCHTNRISLAFVQQLIANQDGSPLSAGNAAKVGDSAQIRLNIPMMNGSFMSMTDSDGSGGLFMFNGKEYLYTHCLEDATNRIVCSRKPSGTVIALIVSQPAAEVLRIRNHGTYASSRAFGSTVRSLRIAVIPNRGIFVQIPSDETTVTNQERSSEQRRMQGLMPIAVFLDTVLFHLDETRRRVTARDIDLLLSGAVDMCDVYDEGLAVPAAEKEHARSIVENIRQFCMMAMPCTRPGSEVAKLPFACEQARAHGPETHRAFLLKEFFPHLESSPSLGSFEDDETGLTRLGLIRCSLGIFPHLEPQ